MLTIFFNFKKHARNLQNQIQLFLFPASGDMFLWPAIGEICVNHKSQYAKFNQEKKMNKSIHELLTISGFQIRESWIL